MKNLKRWMRSTAGVVTVIAATAALVLGASPRAEACGGFFCNLNQPVDQTAERVLYMVEPGTAGKSKITVHIQIAYTGEAKDFSWVLPLVRLPELGVGSDSIFSILEAYTAPRFDLLIDNNTDCNYWNMCPMASAGGGDFGDEDGTKNAGVSVLLHENVGPYDAVVIQANGTNGDLAKDVIDWLNKNGYQQPDITYKEIKNYVAQSYVFLALKLQKDKAAGDLVPIVVTIEETSPCLPIKLTKVAAKDDMPLITWTLGSARAIPKNYLHVVLNDKVIDWMTGGGNYKTVASKAVDLASGHAWITEYAQKAKAFLDASGGSNTFANANWDTSKLKSIKDPGAFLQKLLSDSYPRTTQLQNLIKKFMPKPEAYKDKSDQDFYQNCIQATWCEQRENACWAGCKEAKKLVADGFDPVAFADELDKVVVKPLKEVQAKFEALPYLTRLFTTINKDEMTKDPVFAFNAELPDVSNVHTAHAKPICGADKKPVAMQITYADGSNLTFDVPADSYGYCYGFGPFGPSQAGGNVDSKTGAAIVKGGWPVARVEVIDESGKPVEIDPSVEGLVDKADQLLDKAEVGKPSLQQEFVDNLPKSQWNPSQPWDGNSTKYKAVGASGGSTMCAVTWHTGAQGMHVAAALLAFAALALTLARRRR